MSNNETFLTTSKKYLQGLVLEADKAYFSTPVLVEVIGTDDCGFFIVRDNKRGHTYSASKSRIKKSWQLTNKELEAAKQKAA